MPLTDVKTMSSNIGFAALTGAASAAFDAAFLATPYDTASTEAIVGVVSGASSYLAGRNMFNLLGFVPSSGNAIVDDSVGTALYAGTLTLGVNLGMGQPLTSGVARIMGASAAGEGGVSWLLDD